MRTQSRRTTDAFDSLSVRYTNTKSSSQREKPLPGRSATYGGILYCSRTKRYALVQGRKTGKWSFPKGHPNKGEEAMNCTMRELAEETGIENLPEPTEYVRIGYGNYYVFSLKDTIPLIPRDTNEIMNTKWATLDEMETLSLNADANMYRKSIQVSDSTNQTT
jgi:8-oxo-dGTP pyrophosphatase MutT (NUDIX family)